jgi:hypothetical protein
MANISDTDISPLGIGGSEATDINFQFLFVNRSSTLETESFSFVQAENTIAIKQNDKFRILIIKKLFVIKVYVTLSPENEGSDEPRTAAFLTISIL